MADFSLCQIYGVRPVVAAEGKPILYYHDPSSISLATTHSANLLKFRIRKIINEKLAHLKKSH